MLNEKVTKNVVFDFFTVCKTSRPITLFGSIIFHFFFQWIRAQH